MNNLASKKVVDREARLRRKLVNSEMHPVFDVLLSLFLIAVSPFMMMFTFVHDKIMYRFLNKMYIYNVSWEVHAANIVECIVH
jgi:hypothetical protein